jgi:integrase
MLRAADGRIRALSQDEFQRLLEQLPEHLRDMALFSVMTGLRQGNVTKLQWIKISF